MPGPRAIRGGVIQHRDLARAVATSLCATWLTALLALAWIPRASAQVVPPPLRAAELRAALDRDAPGALTLERWLVIERALEIADAAVDERIRPGAERLMEETGAQSWLNWPSIKSARHARDALLDAQCAIDLALFEGIDGEIPEPLAQALRRVIGVRWRTTRQPWGLLGAWPVDLRAIAWRTLDRDRIGAEADDAVATILDDWETAATPLIRSNAALRRELFDRLEAWLADQGLQLDHLPPPTDAWMVRAFEWWEEHAGPLTAGTRALLELDDATVRRIMAALPHREAFRIRYRVLAASAQIRSYEQRAAVERAFDRAMRLRALAAAERALVEEARWRWIESDATLCTDAVRELRGECAAWCPLTYEHWGPEGRYASARDRLVRLEEDRKAADEKALAGLRSILGRHAGVVTAADGDDDLHFEPRPPAAAGPEDRGRWHARPARACLLGVARTTGWFDDGPLNAECAGVFAAWLGLEGDAAGAWLAGHAAYVDRIEALLLEGGEPNLPLTWTFDERYVHHPVAAQRWLDASLERVALLRSGEAELWLLAEALLADPAMEKRVRLTAAARESVTHLMPIDGLLRRWRLEHRGERPLTAVAVDRLASGGIDPACADAIQAALEAAAPRVLELARKRFESALPAARALALVIDEQMWTRGERGHRLLEERSRLAAELQALDAPWRAEFLAIEQALADVLRSGACAPVGEEIVDDWLAAAYPSVHGHEPPARVVLREERRLGALAGALDDGIDGLIDWYRAADEALAVRARAECDAAGLDDLLNPAAARARGPALTAISDARAELSDRALVRLDLSR